jgi:hypothetical protein
MAKSLDNVIKKANSLADIISKRVSANAPRSSGPKGGNLQRALLKANTLDTMLDVGRGGTKSVPLKTITFTIDYAPDGAEYGMWWNDPTVSSTVRSGKTKNVPDKINFVENALSEPKVIKALDDIYSLLGDTILAGIEDELNKMEAEY